MNERIETNFKELKEYEEIESYYDYLEQAEHFFRDVFGDRVESQKYIIRANKEIERLHSIIEEVRCVYQSLCFSAPENAYIFIEQLGEILDKENK